MDIGNKLKRLRIQRGLTQEEMADRCELSKGFISQAERNLASPSIATLTDMLECLGCTLQEFFTEKDEKAVFSRNDMFVKEDSEGLKGSLTWLVPSAQKNRMEPVLVQLGPGGRTQQMQPYEGEEFGFVLKGSIVLRIRDEKLRVHSGDSFCITTDDMHYIENTSKTKEACFIWISTPPNF